MSDRQEGTGWWMASDGKWYPPESHPDALQESGADGRVAYAGFWLRVWATLIDGVVVNVGVGIIGSVFNIRGGGFLDTEVTAGATILSLGAAWLYSALMESSAGGATIGKMALSLKVTGLEGQRISFGTATARHFGKYLSGLILGIGFMMAGWTARKQALHDMLANTLVIRVPRR